MASTSRSPTCSCPISSERSRAPRSSGRCLPHTAHEEWCDAEGYRFVRIIGTLTVDHLALALDAISEMAKKGRATLGVTHRQTTGILIRIRDLEHPVLYPDAPTPLPPSGRSPTVGTS